MIPRFICWIFGHKYKTIHRFYGVVSGRQEVEHHDRCPRCRVKLDQG